MITYFLDKNHKPKKKNEKYKRITTILKSFDTFVIFATTLSSITLSHTGISLMVIRISAGVAFGLTFSNNVIYEICMQKYNKYKKQYQNDQQTIKSFEKLHRESSQNNVFNKNEYESLSNVFTKFLQETENDFFLKIMDMKKKYFFSNIKLKFNLEPRS